VKPDHANLVEQALARLSRPSGIDHSSSVSFLRLDGDRSSAERIAAPLRIVLVAVNGS
jgi:hypothetical protein